MRHKKTPKRPLTPDPLYQNRLVGKFINRMMIDGKKSIAQSVFYGSFEVLQKQGHNPLEVFEKSLATVGPKTEVKARRVGGANYQVPVEVKGDRKNTLAIRWLLAAARARSNKDYHTFAEKLAAEFLEASQGLGAAVKKRDTVYRMAEANRAFAHFRW